MGRVLADRIRTVLDGANPVTHRPAIVEALTAHAFPQPVADLGHHADKDNTNNQHDDPQNAEKTFDHDGLRSPWKAAVRKLFYSKTSRRRFDELRPMDEGCSSAIGLRMSTWKNPGRPMVEQRPPKRGGCKSSWADC